MQGLIAHSKFSFDYDELPKVVYDNADAMLEARKQSGQTQGIGMRLRRFASILLMISS